MNPPETTTLTLGPKGAALIERLRIMDEPCTPIFGLFDTLRHACAMYRIGVTLNTAITPDADLLLIEHLAAEAADEAERMGL